MKLRNKKTGEIVEVESLDVDTPTEGIVGFLSFDRKDSYNSLAELNSEWEDYEDDDLSKIIEWIDKGLEDEKLPILVNDFVEKLKAWKRLKDKQFKFYGWNKGSLLKSKPNTIEFACDDTEMWSWEDIQDDLDLLFGGEE